MLWATYFWLMALLYSSSWVQLLVGGSHPVWPVADYLLLSVGALQVVGLYGYIWRKPLVSRSAWQALLPIFAVALVATLLVAGVRFSATQNVGVPAATIFVSLLGLPLFLPMLIANRRYAFRSPEIWSTA